MHRKTSLTEIEWLDILESLQLCVPPLKASRFHMCVWVLRHFVPFT